MIPTRTFASDDARSTVAERIDAQLEGVSGLRNLALQVTLIFGIAAGGLLYLLQIAQRMVPMGEPNYPLVLAAWSAAWLVVRTVRGPRSRVDAVRERDATAYMIGGVAVTLIASGTLPGTMNWAGMAPSGIEVMVRAMVGVVATYMLLPPRRARWVVGVGAVSIASGYGGSGLGMYTSSLVVIGVGVLVLDLTMQRFEGLVQALTWAGDRIRGENERLDAEVRKASAQVVRTQDAILVAMASLAEARHEETGDHGRRTSGYVATLLEAVAALPQHAGTLTAEVREQIARAAPLHDIGKLGVPEAILDKPGKLTPDEFAIVQDHCRIGRDIIDQVAAGVDGEVPWLETARAIAYGHHEKWDGSGYPQGAEGEAIPLPARIVAIVDVYDALTSERAYKRAFTPDEAADVIERGSGSHFDPALVQAFASVKDRFAQITRPAV